MNKNIKRFLNRKSTVLVLGKDYQLTMKQEYRLNAVFDIYGSPKQCENWLSTLAYMIKYDLTNYIGRTNRLRKLTASPSVYSLMLRYGKYWKSHYSASAEKRTKHFSNKKSYWEDLGYTLAEASVKVAEVQRERSAKSPSAQKGANEYSIRCMPYWMKQGYSEKDAMKKVSESQSHARSPAVISAWLATLAAKSDEEKLLINRKKGHGIDSFLLRGFSFEKAEQLSYLFYKTRNNYSKSSQTFFLLLDSLLDHDIVYFKVKNYEKQINSFCVDFFDPDSGTVIEYYGDFWHRNPDKYSPDHISYGIKAVDIWKRDSERIAKIKEHTEVNRVIIVWESKVNINPHLAAENIIMEIKNGN